MGLLDDAIREHLDLKRRRGADPTEVERAEREALGPVRRNREAPVSAEGDDDQVAAYDQAGEADWADEAGAEPPYEDEDEPESALPPLELSDRPGQARPAVDEPVFDESTSGESAFEEPSFDDGPGPASPPRFARGTAGDETTEYDVDEALGADEESDDDVLEETPEFLQDTPDHDRLWFEQRPPKDFDFDG